MLPRHGGADILVRRRECRFRAGSNVCFTCLPNCRFKQPPRRGRIGYQIDALHAGDRFDHHAIAAPADPRLDVVRKAHVLRGMFGVPGQLFRQQVLGIEVEIGEQALRRRAWRRRESCRCGPGSRADRRDCPLDGSRSPWPLRRARRPRPAPRAGTFRPLRDSSPSTLTPRITPAWPSTRIGTPRESQNSCNMSVIVFPFALGCKWTPRLHKKSPPRTQRFAVGSRRYPLRAGPHDTSSLGFRGSGVRELVPAPGSLTPEPLSPHSFHSSPLCGGCVGSFRPARSTSTAAVPKKPRRSASASISAMIDWSWATFFALPEVVPCVIIERYHTTSPAHFQDFFLGHCGEFIRART